MGCRPNMTSHASACFANPVQAIFYHMPFQTGIFAGWKALAVSNGETIESIASVG